VNIPDDIDALVVARRVLDNPKTYRVSTHEELAMASCLIGLDQQIERLGIIIRATLDADHLGQALEDLSNHFEQEFPHGES